MQRIRIGLCNEALADGGCRHWIGIEPFAHLPDGPPSAARAIGYVRGLEAAP